jgi:hypothetical protein
MILALLSMFGLIGVAFVVLTGHAQRGAKSIERIGQSEVLATAAPTLLHQAAMQVFRGPNTPATVNYPPPGTGAHSLLEDMYGNGYVTGTISSASASGFAQLLQVTPNIAGALTTAELARRGGCVMTITSVPSGSTAAQLALVGQSTRIIGGNMTGIFVSAFPNGASPPSGAGFTINGVPFSGTGFGYNATTQTLELMYNSGLTPPAIDSTKKMTDFSTTIWPVALLPNLPLSNYYNATTNPLSNPPGGANPDYTAPDIQHTLLAAQVFNGTAVQTLPSFHRPALCRYWTNNTNGLGLSLSATDFSTQSTLNTQIWSVLTPAKLALLRAIIPRPIGSFAGSGADHPNFTGSNPNFNPFWDGVTAGGQWDVDNDGDGVPDSVWVDLGMPVRSTADGHLYKPLFAILCTDLDGRLNVNAHGSLAQTDTTNYNTFASPSSGVFVGTVTAANVARGAGLGPAEINLTPVLSTNYQQVLTGGTVNGTAYQGRYGSGKRPGDSVADQLSINKWFEYDGQNYGQNFWRFMTSPGTATVNDAGSYGSPPDAFGVGAVGLDQAGRPTYVGFNYQGNSANYVGFGSSTQQNPYEINFGSGVSRGLSSGSTASNNPFGVAELERILRPFDRDAPNLPARLAALAPTLLPTSGTAKRLSVTTDSWDVPCPNVETPSNLTATQLALLTNGRVQHVSDMLVARRCPASTTDTNGNLVWPQLLSADVLAGLKMNINRPFGNGHDYDQKTGDDATTAGVIDADVPALALPKQVTLPTSATATAPFSVSYDGTNSLATTPLQARQLEARYLYVLMCMVCDLNYLNGASAFNDATGATTARYIAQWAINTVDFKSRGSIMTPFDYDPTFANPATSITGWNPPGPGSPGYCRVWGCKRPDLLISETLAFHDRRTQDLATDNNTSGISPHMTTTPAPNADSTYDQAYRPQGSLFVELYNPSSPTEPRSGDLYNAPPNGGINLAQVVSSGGQTSPVWRMIITVPAGAGGIPNAEQPDPDEPNPANALYLPPASIERVVYFASAANFNTYQTGIGQVTYCPSSAPTAAVAPGGYAVIGSGEQGANVISAVADPTCTYIGFVTGQPKGGSSARNINLALPGPPSVPLPVLNNTNSPADPGAGQVNAPATLVIDSKIVAGVAQPQRMSVSEPTAGYDGSFETNGGPSPGTGMYATAYDAPFDATRSDSGAIFSNLPLLQYDGTIPAYRFIYLQRLANPLQPFDATNNPYRTIDQQAVDVTAFNGVWDDTGASQTPNDPDPQLTSPAPPTYLVSKVYFQSRQRGDQNDSPDSNGFNTNLWKQEPVAKTTGFATLPPLTGFYFNAALKHSLGYLNHQFGTPQDGTNGAQYVGTPSGIGGAGPQWPFPWLAWNNRPFVSPLELLQIPTCSSSKLLVNAGVNTTDINYNKYFRFVKAAMSPYKPAGLIAGTLFGTDVPYPHLLNFFQSDVSTSSLSPQFHRILEYLGVPSPFIGTETWANPTMATAPFLPPFNRISAYREPGRVNINTIYSQDVFNGLMAAFPDMATTAFWQTFVQSRRGDANTGVLAMPATTVPTEFGRPFRSFGGWSMTPNVGNLQPPREIDCTLLREYPDNSGQPLFQSPTLSTQSYNDMNRNSSFRYQGLQRLGDLATTRSNVYAVWITVGYFEVTPWTPGTDTAHPDGFQLGQELGSDTGEIERHRAFYIFDRTIPVGFQRGQDLNVEKAILVKRFIE